jgi:formate dehydrogenase subunit delta
MDVNKLIRMANQIAANLDCGPDKARAADAVRDHLRRFWSPSMRAQIVAHRMQGGAGLSEVAALAVERLAGDTINAA